MNGADGGEKNGKEAKSRPAPGQGDLWLTRWGRRARLLGEGEARDGNSCIEGTGGASISAK
jgi:hypothetical protein